MDQAPLNVGQRYDTRKAQGFIYNEMERLYLSAVLPQALCECSASIDLVLSYPAHPFMPGMLTASLAVVRNEAEWTCDSGSGWNRMKAYLHLIALLVNEPEPDFPNFDFLHVEHVFTCR